jgi:hypothetical protein
MSILLLYFFVCFPSEYRWRSYAMMSVKYVLVPFS